MLGSYRRLIGSRHSFTCVSKAYMAKKKKLQASNKLADPPSAASASTKCYSQKADKVFDVSLQVTPNASADEVGSVEDCGDGFRLRVKVTAPPDGGKANKAVQKLLAKHFGIAPRDVELRIGATNRKKVFRLTGVVESSLPT